MLRRLHMAPSLVESGDYRVTSRLEPQAEYHPPDNSPKLAAAVVDVETTGPNPDRDKIIEIGICLFEYDRQNGRIYKVLGSWEWSEDPGLSIPPEITNITGITDEMVAGHSIDDRPVNRLMASRQTKDAGSRVSYRSASWHICPDRAALLNVHRRHRARVLPPTTRSPAGDLTNSRFGQAQLVLGERFRFCKHNECIGQIAWNRIGELT